MFKNSKDPLMNFLGDLGGEAKNMGKEFFRQTTAIDTFKKKKKTCCCGRSDKKPSKKYKK
jgi:hypothetical protein